MSRPPRDPGESVFSRGLSRKIIGRGIQIGLSTALVFAAVYLLKDDLALARTMALTTLVFSQLFHVYDCRSEVLTIFELGFFSNKYLLLATVLSGMMHIAIIYVPFLSDIFCTVPLTAADWAAVIAISGWTFFLNCLKHLFFRRRFAMRSGAARA